jgi:hypothetical protein
MLYNADMAVMSIVLNRLQYLRDNPDELAMLFEHYRLQWSYFSAIGCDPEQYIAKIVELFTKKNYPLINVFEGYTRQPSPNFAIFVYSSSSEETKFMGDFHEYATETLTPTVYATNIKVHHIENFEDSSILYISRRCNLQDKIWRLQRVVNPQIPDQSWLVTQIADDGEQYIRVELNDAISEVNGQIPLTGWEFRAFASGWQVEYGISTDAVTARLFLRTAGDIELHKLLCMIVRYCLKSGRHLFEFQNCQLSTMGQSEPQPDFSGEAASGFTSVFNLSFRSTDRWIRQRTRLPERITFQVQAYSDPDDSATDVTEEI